MRARCVAFESCNSAQRCEYFASVDWNILANYLHTDASKDSRMLLIPLLEVPWWSKILIGAVQSIQFLWDISQSCLPNIEEINQSVLPSHVSNLTENIIPGT
jgi:hypothetical protein